MRFGGLDRCDGSLCDGELLGFKCVGVFKLQCRAVQSINRAVELYILWRRIVPKLYGSNELRSVPCGILLPFWSHDVLCLWDRGVLGGVGVKLHLL